MFTFGSSDDDDDDDDRSDNKSSFAFFIKTWGKGLGTRETWQTFTFMYKNCCEKRDCLQDEWTRRRLVQFASVVIVVATSLLSQSYNNSPLYTKCRKAFSVVLVPFRIGVTNAIYLLKASFPAQIWL